MTIERQRSRCYLRLCPGSKVHFSECISGFFRNVLVRFLRILWWLRNIYEERKSFCREIYVIDEDRSKMKFIAVGDCSVYRKIFLERETIVEVHYRNDKWD